MDSTTVLSHPVGTICVREKILSSFLLRALFILLDKVDNQENDERQNDATATETGGSKGTFRALAFGNAYGVVDIMMFRTLITVVFCSCLDVLLLAVAWTGSWKFQGRWASRLLY